ncbi:MAG: hypothetical protein ACKVOR_12730 [Flavobacteriales bacterium]
MMRYTTLLLLVPIVMVLVASCKKNDDTSAPYINITGPSAGSTYSYLDVIGVSAHVSDNVNLQSIKVTVTNAAGQKFLQEINYANAGREKHIATTLVHNDQHLVTGTYYITITVSDGENEMTAFREITLYEGPTVLETTFVLTQSISDFYSLNILDNSTITSQWVFSGEVSNVHINSRYDRLYHFEESSKLVEIRQGNSGAYVGSQYFSTGTFGDVFFNCTANDESSHKLYFSTDEYTIYSASTNGNFTIEITLPGGYTANHMEITEDYLYAHCENITNTAHHIAQYLLSTGELMQSLDLPMSHEIMGLHAIDNEHVLLAGNENSNSLFKIYNAATNATNGVFTLYNQFPCSGLWPALNGAFIVAHNNNLVRYNNDIEIEATSTAIGVATSVAVEKISGKVYSIISGDIYEYAYSDLSNTAFVNGSGTARKVLFRYNK